jgi:hypothetical protein
MIHDGFELRERTNCPVTCPSRTKISPGALATTTRTCCPRPSITVTRTFTKTHTTTGKVTTRASTTRAFTTQATTKTTAQTKNTAKSTSVRPSISSATRSTSKTDGIKVKNTFIPLKSDTSIVTVTRTSSGELYYSIVCFGRRFDEATGNCISHGPTCHHLSPEFGIWICGIDLVDWHKPVRNHLRSQKCHCTVYLLSIRHFAERQWFIFEHFFIDPWKWLIQIDLDSPLLSFQFAFTYMTTMGGNLLRFVGALGMQLGEAGDTVVATFGFNGNWVNSFLISPYIDVTVIATRRCVWNSHFSGFGVHHFVDGSSNSFRGNH